MFSRIRSGLAVTVVTCSVIGCSQSSSKAPPASTVSGVTSQTTPPATPAPPASPPAVATLGPGGALTPAFRLAVAREFSPRLRFNGYHNDGNPSAQNRSEDFFPMGLRTFFRRLENGQAHVLVQGSSGSSAGVSAVQTFIGAATFGADTFGPYPRDMVGDAPGAAPIYIHVYEDPAARSLAADGSGELVVFAEYWLFYAADRAEVSFFGLVTAGPNDLFGHRGDWEHTSYRVRLRFGPGSVLHGGTIEEGYYYGHGFGNRVGPALIEVVNDAGQPDPSGTHPVVYIAQGKHASYPQAGHWTQVPLPVTIADHTDFFRGNGVVVDSWGGQFFDLEDVAGQAAEFSSPEFQAISARSPINHLDWTLYDGRWGPDNVSITIGGQQLGLGVSPTGPKAKSSYGDFGASAGQTWTSSKLLFAPVGLNIYADQGITIPDMSPPPTPIRQ